MVGIRKQGRPLEVFCTVSEKQRCHGIDVVGAGIAGKGTGARQTDVDETATDIHVQLEPASNISGPETTPGDWSVKQGMSIQSSDCRNRMR